MEFFHQEIQEILHRQQILELLKANRQNTYIFHDIYAARIIAHYRHKTSTARQFKTVLAYLLIACIPFCGLLFMLILGAMLLLSGTEPSTDIVSSTTNTTQSPWQKAEAAMKKGDYDTARAFFIEAKETYPLNGIILIDYAELLQREDQHDEAAMMLIDFLNNVSGTQNIKDGDKVYMKLKELTGPFSPNVEEAYQNCISACEDSLENFEFLDSLIESEKYRLALHFCDAMHEENVAACNLCTYYYMCYTQLGEYEECAVYFLDLADQWEQESLPINAQELKIRVRGKLKELRPFVCESTQQKIDATLLKLERDS